MPISHAASRDRSLDTLRGSAIGLVLVGHYLHFAPYQLAGAPVGTWVRDFGHGGVLLFFILSGYLIYVTAQTRDAATFLVKRLAKIVPAYWVNVAAVFAAGLLAGGMFPVFGLKDTLANLLFLEGQFGIAPLSGVYWTLVIEVKFYLIFAALFFTPLRPVLMLVPIACLTLNGAAVGLAGRGSVLLTYLPAFFVGIALARERLGHGTRAAVAAMLAVAMASLVVGAQFRGLQAAAFLGFDAALFWLITTRGVASALLARLGLISYSIYLYHTTLGYPLLEALGTAGIGSVWWAGALGVTGIVLAVSYLSFQWIEQTFVAAANRVLQARITTPHGPAIPGAVRGAD